MWSSLKHESWGRGGGGGARKRLKEVGGKDLQKKLWRPMVGRQNGYSRRLACEVTHDWLCGGPIAWSINEEKFDNRQGEDGVCERFDKRCDGVIGERSDRGFLLLCMFRK